MSPRIQYDKEIIMNEEYVKLFVENFKKHLSDVLSVKIELETVLAFKDKEIEALKAEIAELKKTENTLD
jgi:uncharacterized small protein (DUF1192 family)